MADSQIRLVPYTQFASNASIATLARRLSGLVKVTEVRLLTDFPAVVRRYEEEDTAYRSIKQVRETMRKRGGTFGAYAVEVDGVVWGVASFDQRWLTTRIFGWGRFGLDVPMRRGPMLALWLGSGNRPKGLLPAILREAAKMLANNRKLQGGPWTLVRTNRPEVLDALGDLRNGFGGFSASVKPDNYAHIDGVRAPRVVCAARLSVGAMRAMRE